MKANQLAFVFLITLACILIVWAFSTLPLDQPGQAVDWKVFYQSTHQFQISYPGNRVYNPPWVLVLLWPLTILSLPMSRGLAALVTLAVFFISVPRINDRVKWASSVLLLLFSYPMIRHLMDGNLEAMIVGGVLLALYSMRKQSVVLMVVSLILLSSKVQESWLFVFALVLLLWRDWPRKPAFQSLLGAGIFALPFFIWKGAEWQAALQVFPYSQTAIDSNLLFVLAKLGVNEWIAWTAWAGILATTLYVLAYPKIGLDRSRAAFLIIAGLMLSNYAAGDSLVTPLALGVIPFFQRKPWIGFSLVMLYFLPYSALTDIQLRLAWENVYWAGVLLITWALLAWELIEMQRQVTKPLSA